MNTCIFPAHTVRAEIHRAPQRDRKFFFFTKAALHMGGTKVIFTPRTGSNTGQAVFFLIASHDGSAKPIGTLLLLARGIAGGSLRFLLMCAGYAQRLSGLISLRSQISGTLQTLHSWKGLERIEQL